MSAIVADVPGATAGFTEEVRSRARRRDLALLAVVPVALVCLFALPRATKLALVFDASEPTLATAFASHFVHLSAGHLVANLVGYLLLAPLAYLLCLLVGDRWLFVTAHGTFLLAFPLALSVLELAVAFERAALGFSAINGAFFGLLSFALASYAGTQFGVGRGDAVAPMGFFVGVAIIAVLVVPSAAVAAGVAAAAILSAGLYVAGAAGRLGRRSVVGSVARLRAAAGRPGYVELGGAGTSVFLAYPLVAFPADPATGSGVVNLYSHLLGFCLAFVATYVTAQVADRHGDGQ